MAFSEWLEQHGGSDLPRRCRAHFLHNLLAYILKTGQPLAGTLMRQVFVRPGAKSPN